MRRDSRAPLLARNLVSFCLSREPKAKVVTNIRFQPNHGILTLNPKLNHVMSAIYVYV